MQVSIYNGKNMSSMYNFTGEQVCGFVECDGLPGGLSYVVSVFGVLDNIIVSMLLAWLTKQNFVKSEGILILFK